MSLTLSEADLATLAATLAPILLPYIRRALVDDIGVAIERIEVVDVEALAGRELGEALGLVFREIFADGDEKRFGAIQPITLGTTKGEGQ